jgi:hypothetical protein
MRADPCKCLSLLSLLAAAEVLNASAKHHDLRHRKSVSNGKGRENIPPKGNGASYEHNGRGFSGVAGSADFQEPVDCQILAFWISRPVHTASECNELSKHASNLRKYSGRLD